VLRAPLLISMGCCLSLLACKPSKVLVEGVVFLDGVGLGFVDVELIPEEPMRDFVAKSTKLNERPPAKFSVKTELDGSFFLKVAPGPYAVFARTKDRTWLFWRTIESDGDQPRLQLNNDNLTDSGCAQCVALVPEVKEVEAPPSAPVKYAVMVNDKSPPPAMSVMGAIDRQLVYEVVHRFRAQIRYCHESIQLNSSPNLHGRIAVKFVISPKGSVATSMIAQSTIPNAQLEACIAGRVRTWKFPKPKGGGVAIVTYPFTFVEQ
jgi:TonB family protein